MNSIFAYISNLFNDAIHFKYRNKAVLALYSALIIGLVFFLTGSKDVAKDEEVKTVASVSVASVRDLASGKSFTAVGTVEAVSEARLQAEAGGRVTSVLAEIGDTVRAGSILATLESGAERASLLQAEGAYEAALAGAKQSESGERGAEIALVSAQEAALASVRSAYTTANDTLISTIDQFYSNPQDKYTPGVRVSGDTKFLSEERIAFQTIMPRLQEASAKTNNDNLPALMTETGGYITRMITLIDTFLAITSDTDNKNDILLGQPLPSYSAQLIGRRTALNGILSNLQNEQTGLTTAEENLKRAAIGATGGAVSLSDAQVKIALGSLRAAQANYERTVVRTPITGVVNALYLKSGDYIAPSAPAAIVANNNGLEISTSVSQEDSVKLTIGDTVTINKTATGTIAAIAGAIDPTTGKVAVKVSVDDQSTLQNGLTVSISFSTDSKSATAEITIPLSAVKMTGSGPVVFSVDAEKNTLTARPVVLGAVSGSTVIVTEGVTPDVIIVSDARGLKEGQEVTISSN